MSVILIGEAPTDHHAASDPKLALTGRVGRTMCKLADVPWLYYLYVTDRRNIFDVPTEKWDARAAEKSADAMTPFQQDRIVLLGARVARAFRVESWPLYQWRPMWGGLAVRVPHPSGLNRQLNDPDHRTRMGDVLREAMCSE